jgi:hypothetical protein
MNPNPQNRRIAELEAELDVMGIRVTLRLEVDGVRIVSSKSEADRLLAKSELRKKGVQITTDS